jgi:putative DNA primase/helicase
MGQAAGGRSVTVLTDTARELDELAARRWKSSLQTTKSGETKGNITNIGTALESAPELTGIAAFDTFTRRVLLVRRPPWERDGFARRAWRDADDAELLSWLQQNGIPAAATSTVADAVRMVAERHQFDALADFLGGLEWDGRERLSRWLTCTYLDADDSPLIERMGRAG